MKTILVPVDGSSNSLRAVAYAASQSQYGPVTVHLLHVEPQRDDYGMVRVYVSKQQYSRMTKARAGRILARAAKPLRAAKVPCRAHAAVGEVAPMIVATARRLKCESIVMGTRGMGSLASLFLGSVATKVVHLARVPVTLVK